MILENGTVVALRVHGKAAGIGTIITSQESAESLPRLNPTGIEYGVCVDGTGEINGWYLASEVTPVSEGPPPRLDPNVVMEIGQAESALAEAHEAVSRLSEHSNLLPMREHRAMGYCDCAIALLYRELHSMRKQLNNGAEIALPQADLIRRQEWRECTTI